MKEPASPVYADALPIRDALQIYFEFYGFKNGGYDQKWFKIKFTDSFALPLPNIKARVDAVKLHDIHHIVTGYPANLKGEALIGAWELASGCGKFYIGWLLNFSAFLYGIWLWPKEMLNAFNRGLNSENLYHGIKYDESLLNSPVAMIRSGLLDRKSPSLSVQTFSLLFWLCAAFITTIFTITIAVIVIGLILKLVNYLL